MVGVKTNDPFALKSRSPFLGSLTRTALIVLPALSSFYELPNVIVTPHTAWSSGRVLDRSVDLFCDNLRRFANGEPLLNVVDPDAGY